MNYRDSLMLLLFLVICFVHSKGVYIFFSTLFLTLNILIMLYNHTIKRRVSQRIINKKEDNLKYLNSLLNIGILCLLLYSFQDASFEKVSSLMLLSMGIGIFLFVLKLLAENISW